MVKIRLLLQLNQPKEAMQSFDDFMVFTPKEVVPQWAYYVIAQAMWLAGDLDGVRFFFVGLYNVLIVDYMLSLTVTLCRNSCHASYAVFFMYYISESQDVTDVTCDSVE